MTYVWLICVFILHALVFSCAADKPGCQKTLSLCKLPLTKKEEKGEKGLIGDKGDIGFQGEIGERGPDGKLGPIGRPGRDGSPGSPGIKGDAIKGPVGSRGIKGEQGDQGQPGTDGRKGQKGDKGGAGTEIGPPGSPGVNGVCPGPVLEGGVRTSYEPIDITEVCKDLGSVKTGNYTINISDDFSFAVKCIIRKHASPLTCIDLPPRTGEPYSFQNISTGFWLSSQGLTLDKLYGLDVEAIDWIQRRSNSAFQTIKYHCKNSIPVSRDTDKADKSVLLLTWNDNTIGPMPTSTKPFFYSVGYDGCSKSAKDKWNYTEIKLVSSSPRRVPVIDFFIRDVGNEINQEFEIEVVELCFD